VEVDLILRCPIGGEDWPITSYKSVVDATKEVQRLGTIHLWCPAGHCFTLSRALRGKMFTKQQAENILAYAQRLVEKGGESNVH